MSAKKKWRADTNGCGWCAMRISDGWLYLDTFETRKRAAADVLWINLLKIFKWEEANVRFREHRIVKVIVERAP